MAHPGGGCRGLHTWVFTLQGPWPQESSTQTPDTRPLLAGQEELTEDPQSPTSADGASWRTHHLQSTQLVNCWFTTVPCPQAHLPHLRH